MRLDYKKHLFMFLSLSILFSIFANTTTVFAKGKEELDTIASEGFFTKSFQSHFPSCKEMKKMILEDKRTKELKNDERLEDNFYIHKVYEGDETDPKKMKEDKEHWYVRNNDNTTNSKAISKLGEVVAEFIYDKDGDTSKGVIGMGCGVFNLLPNVTQLQKPINITNSPIIMGLVYKMQVLALGTAVLMMALFGLYYTTGNETTDPVKFLIRGFFTMFLIYNIPFLAQDILNINNMLVYWIGINPVPKPDGLITVSMIMVNMMSGLTAIMSALFTMLSLSLVPGVVLLGTTILLVVVGMLLQNVLQMLLWWYFRFIMIIFLIFLAPIYLVLGILPKTAHYLNMWFKYFIGEVFTQSSMMLALWFSSHILGNVRSLGDSYSFSLIGYVLITLSLFKLLGRIPKISKKIIGKDFGGLNAQDALNASKNISTFIQNIGFAMAGAATNKTQKHASYREAAKMHQLQSKMNSPEFQRMSPQEQNKVFNEIQTLEGRQAARERRGRKANMFMASFESGKPSIGGSMESIQKSAEARAKGRDKERKERIYALERHRLEELYRKSTREEVDKDIEHEYERLLAQKNEEESKLRRYQKEKGENEETYEDGQRAIDTKYREQKEMLDAINNDKWKEAQVRKRKEQARQELEYVVSDMLPIEGYDTPMSRREDVTREANERYKQIHKNVFGNDKNDEDKKK